MDFYGLSLRPSVVKGLTVITSKYVGYKDSLLEWKPSLAWGPVFIENVQVFIFQTSMDKANLFEATIMR